MVSLISNIVARAGATHTAESNLVNSPTVPVSLSLRHPILVARSVAADRSSTPFSPVSFVKKAYRRSITKLKSLVG